MANGNKTPEEILNESNRVNNINQRVHDMGDATINVSMSVYELLKQNGYDLSSNFGPLYDYCKKKNNDMIVINRDVKALVSYEEDLSKPNAEKVNAEFENITTKDICDQIKRKVLGLEASYVKTAEIEVENAAAGMEDFIKEMNECC